MDYADLEVLVQRWSDGAYAVDMRFRTTDGQADSELALNAPIQLDFERLLSLFNQPDQYGRALAGMLFANAQLLGAWQRVRGFADGTNMALRLRLRLDPAASELQAVRWELLFDPERDTPIGQSERMVFSRYLDSADLSRITLAPRDKMQALLVVASPRDLAKFQLMPFDAAAECERVRQALGDIPGATLCSGDGGPPVSLNAICDALRFGYSVLYLVCHGTLRDGQPMLCLENDNGETTWVAGDELADRIAGLGSALRPLLVVLASCQSVGLGNGSAVPAALGPRLARSGVGAVLGMQGDVPMDLVARLMPRFFGELIVSGEIDQALAVGRAALGNDTAWWMPVLFLRVREGRLWREPSPQAVSLPNPPAPPPPQVHAPRRLWAGGALAIVALLGAVLAVLLRMPLTANGPPPVATAQLALALTVAPTIAPLPTPAPPAPLTNGKFMLLLSQLDLRGQPDRDLLSEIADDLQRSVADVPFSDIEVVRYAGVVRSDAEAAALAQSSKAAVVIWGSGNGQSLTLRLRVGDPSVFAGIPPELSAELLRRSANVDLRMDTTANSLPSTALAVLAIFNVLKTASGDGFEILRVAALLDRLKNEVVAAEPIGSGSAPKLHRYLRLYYSQPELARAEIDAALDDDPANPLLLVYSGVLHQRLNEYEDGYEDAQAAADAVPGWASPLYLLAVDRLVKGFPEQSLAFLDELIAARPDDIYALSYRGAYRYLNSYDEAASADLNRAIELGPQTSLPYTFATVLALRASTIEQARVLVAESQTRFSAQRSFDNNFYRNLFGQENLFGLTIAAFDQLLAGQNRDAIASAQQALAFPDNPVLTERLRADLNFIIGLAECRRGEWVASADAYSQALAFDPQFTLLHLLRSQPRNELGDTLGTIEDITAVAQSSQAAQLQPYVDAAQRGELSCQTILN